MTMQSDIAPILVLTWGNPSRGDDALGTALYDLLVEHKSQTGTLNEVDLHTDFQLQIEHAVDLVDRKLVIFVDAGVGNGVDNTEPYSFERLQPQRDDSFTTHAMSPATVLSVYQQVYHQQPPPAYLLTIQAYEFGLGTKMSDRARSNLKMACKKILAEISAFDPTHVTSPSDDSTHSVHAKHVI